MSSLVKGEGFDQVFIITINRPDARNAISSEVLLRLYNILVALRDDSNVRVVIVTGAGNKAFSAGADLKERRGMNVEETCRFVKRIQHTCQMLGDLPIPTIAAINGDAFGGGLELALACDIRIACKSASLGLTEVSLGIIPGAGGTQRLPRIVGLSNAMDMIFSAKRLSADEALAIGLVNYLELDAANVLHAAQEKGLQISKNAPLAVRAAKKAMVAAMDLPLSEGLMAELDCYKKILHTEDRLEGLRAFQEKRRPRYLGK